jgi:membrane protein implicated in regulation of membrane protease activity
VAIEHTAAVEAPVEAAQHACKWRLAVDERSDGEARLGRRPRQQQAAAVGREREGLNSVRERREPLGHPAGERHAVHLTVTHEEHVAAVGREDGRAVVDRPAGQRARPPAPRLDAPDPGAVGVSLDRTSCVRDERTVAGDRGIAERNLAADEARGRQRHRSEDTVHMSLLIALALALWVLPRPWGVVAVIGALVLEIVEIRWGLKLARARSSTGVEALIGQRAEAATALDPTGQVLVHGERWAARSSRAVEPGTTVEIDAVNGLELSVTPVWPGPREG